MIERLYATLIEYGEYDDTLLLIMGIAAELFGRDGYSFTPDSENQTGDILIVTTTATLYEQFRKKCEDAPDVNTKKIHFDYFNSNL